MNLSARNIAFKNDGIPRVSGDEPWETGAYSRQTLYSPRERG